MAREPQPIDISQSPEMLRLVEQIGQSGQPRRLSRRGKTVAVLTPVNAAPRKRTGARRRTGLLTPDDPFWRLVGIGRSGLGDVSANKQKYLGDAYYPTDNQSSQ